MVRNFRGITAGLKLHLRRPWMLKKKEVMYYLTETSLCTFFSNFNFFSVRALPHLSNMPTSFCAKVLKYKTEYEGLPTRMS